MTHSFCWLHISDLHFGHGSPPYAHDQDLVLARLAADARELVRDGRVPAPDAILITGDIGNSGASKKASEYDDAHLWVTRLAKDLGVEIGSVYSVPGNHDVDWDSRKERVLYRLVDGLRRGAPIDGALDDSAERSMLSNQLAGYRDLMTKLGSPSVGKDELAIDWSTDIPIGGGYFVRLAGVNTALLCADDDFEKLQVGVGQVKAAVMPEAGPGTVTILLAHHPFDWLQPDDNASTTAWVTSMADLLLTGHIHDPSTSQFRRGGGSELIRIAAGAVHSDEKGPRIHAFSFGCIEIDDEGGCRTRIWPRKWAGGGNFVLDSENVDNEKEGYAEHLLRRPLEPHGAAVRDKPDDPLEALAQDALRRMGSRRTAFPTDYSIAELAEHDFLVQPRLLPVSGSNPAPVDIAELVSMLEAGEAAVVIGNPGAGKTVLSYLVFNELLRRANCVPFTVSVVGLTEMAQPLTREAILQEALNESVGANAGVAEGDRQIALVLDGLDEAAAAGVPVGGMADVIQQLPALGSVLLTCRTREFEDHFLTRIDLDAFRGVWSLDKWRIEDFASYIEKLVNAGLLESNAILEAVETSGTLKQLVETPLLARMLTFVLSKRSDTDVDLASLYSSYLQALARPVEARLRRTNCEVENVYELWRGMSWDVFRNKLFVGATLPSGVPSGLLSRQHGLPSSCAQTVADGLLDYVRIGPDLVARYRHYSFFEFLVADFLAAELFHRSTSGAPHVWDLLETDLPREIRRHLVRLIKRAAPKLIVELLASHFRNLQEGISEATTRRIAGNLMAYILARIGMDASEFRSLLDTEADPFLRTSLYWALANAGDVDQTVAYMKVLAEDAEMASLNRGYLLYYHGDVDRDRPPPYLDDDLAQEWTLTRSRTAELMGAPAYVDRKSAPRRALDVYTFLDFAVGRETQLTNVERALMESIIGTIRDENPKLASPLESLVGRVRSS